MTYGRFQGILNNVISIEFLQMQSGQLTRMVAYDSVFLKEIWLKKPCC